MKVKLPKLELKPYDWDIIKWKPFWDQFNASIHSNNVISKIEKFSYLKTFLNESASSCISGLTLTTENYDEAVKILEERFGNTQILVSAFMTFWLKIGPLGILEMLIPNPDFWNSDPKIHVLANLGPKIQCCPFCLKIGAHSISRILISNQDLAF